MATPGQFWLMSVHLLPLQATLMASFLLKLCLFCLCVTRLLSAKNNRVFECSQELLKILKIVHFFNKWSAFISETQKHH